MTTATSRDRVAEIVAPALECAPDEVVVRREVVPWIRRLATFRASGPPGNPFPAGLLVTMPNGQVVPPLVFAAVPVWDQHWIASALLRSEGIEPTQTDPALLAEICRVTLAGIGGHIATRDRARRDLGHPEPYDTLAPYCAEPEARFGPTKWALRFTYVAPDGAVERWQVAGAAHYVHNAECELLQPPGAWPLRPRRG